MKRILIIESIGTIALLTITILICFLIIPAETNENQIASAGLSAFILGFLLGIFCINDIQGLPVSIIAVAGVLNIITVLGKIDFITVTGGVCLTAILSAAIILCLNTDEYPIKNNEGKQYKKTYVLAVDISVFMTLFINLWIIHYIPRLI
jgi:hypothetical protein